MEPLNILLLFFIVILAVVLICQISKRREQEELTQRCFRRTYPPIFSNEYYTTPWNKYFKKNKELIITSEMRVNYIKEQKDKIFSELLGQDFKTKDRLLFMAKAFSNNLAYLPDMVLIGKNSLIVVHLQYKNEGWMDLLNIMEQFDNKYNWNTYCQYNYIDSEGKEQNGKKLMESIRERWNNMRKFAVMYNPETKEVVGFGLYTSSPSSKISDVEKSQCYKYFDTNSSVQYVSEKDNK